jgi:hypothetical protein
MSLMLDEDESFSLTANVVSPGYQSMVLKGYLVSRRANGVYVAPLIPQLFYGAEGTQLQTWRQYISGTGEQTILSRVGGEPSVPREELYWRKVSDFEEKAPAPTPKAVIPTTQISTLALPIGFAAIGALLIYLPTRK